MEVEEDEEQACVDARLSCRHTCTHEYNLTCAHRRLSCSRRLRNRWHALATRLPNIHQDCCKPRSTIARATRAVSSWLPTCCCTRVRPQDRRTSGAGWTCYDRRQTRDTDSRDSGWENFSISVSRVRRVSQTHIQSGVCINPHAHSNTCTISSIVTSQFCGSDHNFEILRSRISVWCNMIILNVHLYHMHDTMIWTRGVSDSNSFHFCDWALNSADRDRQNVVKLTCRKVFMYGVYPGDESRTWF